MKETRDPSVNLSDRPPCLTARSAGQDIQLVVTFIFCVYVLVGTVALLAVYRILCDKLMYCKYFGIFGVV